MSRYFDWKPYVPVAVRRARALKKMEKLRKKGLNIKPVEIEGRKIAHTFWGKAWCDHLESFSDYANRLPRGRTYVRNGSVCHLDIAKGKINANVCGSELYTVKVVIETLPSRKWENVKNRCAGKIGSLLELLQGKLSENVMAVVTDRDNGLFPLPGEISLHCSCPDWAVMCKHVAAVLYGVGARLDREPELLFLLRGVDHDELVSADLGMAAVAEKKGTYRRIEDDILEDVFGIEMSEDVMPATTKPFPRRKTASPKAEDASGASVERTAKRGRESDKDTSQTAGASACQERAPTSDSTALAVTGKTVAKLRAKFHISQSEFARLLGVSTPSIGNWEKNPGPLKLQARTLNAWNAAKGLTKQQARRKLDEL
jgi:uncharacterized Zn finger protein